VPGLAAVNDRYFAVGEAARLMSLLQDAGFADVEIHSESHTFTLPSFDAFYGPFERGAGSTGQTLATLPEEVRHAIREEVRRDLNDTGGPVDVEVEVRFASGRR